MADTREKEARFLTAEAKRLNLLIGRSSLALGKIYKRVNEQELFREAGYDSFELWLEAVGGIGRSQAYSVIKTYTTLEESQVPAEAIQRMPLNNARDLTRVASSKRTAPEVLEAAAELPNSQFRKYLENKVQPGIALEPVDYKGFKVQEGALKVVQRALDMAVEQSGAETEGAALEYICAEWLAGQAGVTSEQRNAVLRAVKVVEDIVGQNSAEIPPVLSPTPPQWAQVLLAVTEIQATFKLTPRTVKVEAGGQVRDVVGLGSKATTVQ